MPWKYHKLNLQQFSTDGLDNNRPNTKDNVRLVCLECNRRRGCAPPRGQALCYGE